MTRPTALALDFVRGELAREQALRDSLEQRANSLISAYTATVAVGIALAALIGLDSEISTGAPLILICIGGGVIALGLFAALVAIVPLNLGATDASDLRQLSERAAADHDTDDVMRERQGELVAMVVEEILVLRRLSAVKAIALLIGSIGFVASLALFAVAFFVAL